MALPRSILLIITGSVAAYKSLELIRLLKERGVEVHAILSKGGAEFITPLAISSLTGTQTYHDLFSLTDEVTMGHIELSRIAELVLVAPASADIIAKMASGQANDLATTALLATDKPVVIAPAMNHKMWSHAATQRNIEQLKADGIRVVEPTEGAMACGEYGVGRLAEPAEIVRFITEHAQARGGALKGKRAIVTSGPTHEPVDPVRFLGNHASGKQGHAVAEALAAQGAEVTLISGPVNIPTPAGVKLVSVKTADEMFDAVNDALPADIFVGAAAVADWRMTHVSPHKIKKHGKVSKLTLELVPTQDILASVANHKKRPALVIGFAAETDAVENYARSKLQAKGCDFVLGNNVEGGKVFNADDNTIVFVTANSETKWPKMSKRAVGEKLAQEIIEYFSTSKKRKNAS
jgi:phosphopantothenoylcysteine decarboxylase/phosphopantothenate--cysteine ligase